MSSDDRPSQQVLDQLTPRERKILKNRFGIDADTSLSLEEVEKQFNITRARILEIEKQMSDDDPNDAA